MTTHPLLRRSVTLALLFVAASCGDDKSAAKDGGHGSGSGSAIDAPRPDAPPLDPDAGTPHAACTPGTHGTHVVARKIGAANDAAMIVASPPADPRLFVVERVGAIRLFETEVKVSPAFLDISDKVVSGGEQGMLGLAFHPDYVHNGYFYVDYTATNTDTATNHDNAYVDVVARYKVSADNPDKADPTSGQILLSIPDFASNHNAGMMEFGSDGYLYISTGDGGSGGDPKRNGQNTNALLAKILRIDVDHPSGTKNYGIPADNPFATTGGAPEVWLYGVRNPWRWSFDKLTGDLWIGDVGQDVVEEIDVLEHGEQAGKNLGWSMYEATNCCATDNTNHCEQATPYQTCNPATPNLVNPVLTKTHSGDGFFAIIGGEVYRGTCFPDLAGTYFFTDNVQHGLWTAKLAPDGLSLTDVTALPAPAGGWPGSPASIHADSRGELYETTTNGFIYAIEATP